jgi:hypothetical protein
MAVTVKVARCNLPPRTTVRGPGKASSVIIIEQVLQQLAATLGQDPLQFRESLMMKIPPDCLAAAAAREAAAAEMNTSSSSSNTHGHQNSAATTTAATAAAAATAAPGSLSRIPHPKYFADIGNFSVKNGSSSGRSSGDVGSSSGGNGGGSSSSCIEDASAAAVVLRTSFGQQVELHTYTLPYLWQQLQQQCCYQQRRKEVDEFNKHNRLHKKGLAMVPTR